MTMRKKLFVFVMYGLLLLAVSFAPTMVQADWSISFGDNGWNPEGTLRYAFNKVEFFIPNVPENEGIYFTANGATNFSQTGWSVPMVTETHLSAGGPAVADTLYWTLNFTDPVNLQNFVLTLDYVIYANNDPAFGIRLFLNNGQLNLTPDTGWVALNASRVNSYGQSPVPVPPAILLLGTGLVGVVALRKRIHS
jgi:hypothetical protein